MGNTNQPGRVIGAFKRANKAVNEFFRIQGSNANSYVEFDHANNVFDIKGTLKVNGSAVAVNSSVLVVSSSISVGNSTVNSSANGIAVETAGLIANDSLRLGGNSTINLMFNANSTMIGANATGVANTEAGVLRIEVNGTSLYLQAFTNPGV